jgi:uncharacterized protein (TIGR02452 family)
MNKLQKIAEDTIKAIDAGKYTNPSGKIIPIEKLITSSVKRSKLYRPNDSELDWEINKTRKIIINPIIEVTRESSLEAAYRLANESPCLLNFASSKHPGGGFLRGAPAQEESIARSSGLYPTLIKHPEFYEENKKSQRDNIGLYLDYAIYSPGVPVIRNDAGDWLEDPYFTAVLTSPAPNRAAILNEKHEVYEAANEGKDAEDEDLEDDIDEMDDEIEKTLDKRMHQVLSIMAANGHRTIILGAWGCGVFGNDPLTVAGLFRDNLQKLPFFDKVVFAIYDKRDAEVVRSFVQIFGIETDPNAGTINESN